MTKNKPRRADLIAQLADHVLAHGLGSASLRPLAAAVGTSDRMLLYYFPDKAALVSAVLETLAARMMTLLDVYRVSVPLLATELHDRLQPFVLDDNAWPFMQLWLEIASLAARGDRTCRHVGETIARGFLAWTAEQVSAPDDAVRRTDATRVLMAIEGAVLLKSLGLEDEVVAAATTSRMSRSGEADKHR